MKPNKKISERLVNNFGFNTVDSRAKQIFVDKFVEKASAGLENAIKSGALSTTQAPAQTSAPTQSPQAQQIAQTRQQKQAAAAKAAQDQMNKKPGQPAPAGTAMPTKPYQVPGLGTNPTPTKSAPTQPKQKQFKATAGPNPEDYANLEKRIKAQSQIQRESKYERLNSIFESILNEQTPSISSFVTDAFQAYAGQVTDPQMQQQLKALSDEVQSTYAKDKGVAALKKLGSLAYAQATTNPTARVPSSQQTQATRQAPQSVQTQTEPDQAQQATTAPQAYNQMLGILNKLDPKSQQKIVQALNQYIKMGKI